MYGKEFIGYGVNGTPADCIKIAVASLLPGKPDIVVSGINLGSNFGIDILYSGTVSAATEAAILGIPSFAVSLASFINPDFRFAARFSRYLAQSIIKKGLPQDTILNVNVPNVPEKMIKGIQVVPQSKARYRETYEKREDPRIQTYYWLTGEFKEKEFETESDLKSVKKNYISITPLRFDLTNYEHIEKIKEWKLEDFLRQKS